MAAKASSAVVALAGLVGAALLVSALGRTPERPPAGDVDAIAQAVDARVREAAAGVQARSSTLADLTSVRAAVATDKATVRDLTRDELMFRPRTDEIILLDQVPKAGAPVRLLELPESAVEMPPMASGVHLLVAGKQLWVASSSVVDPADRSVELHGVVTVAQRIDLADVAARVGRLGVPARIADLNAPLELGDHALPSGAATISRALASDPTHRASIAFQRLPGARSLPGIIIAVCTALFGLVAASLLALRGRAPAALAATPVPAGAATPAPVATPAPASDPALAATGFAPTLVPGTKKVGRYTVQRELGAGGMAKIYLARATGEAGFERQVALKVIQPHMAQNVTLVNHFLDEARLASRLTHPNVVHILDLGKADDEYFIAMEFIDGADLGQLLAHARDAGRPVPVRVALTILRRLCDGLHAAHTATDEAGTPLDIVHRDVKAPNVFVSREGAVKLGDFGIATAKQEARAVQTEAGITKGTFAYMAPEQRLGKVPVDRRVDVFAVGAVGYELFAGVEVNLDYIRHLGVKKEDWPPVEPLAKVRPDAPAELDAVLRKAMAFERDDRYATCAELEAALEAVADKYGLGESDKVVAAWVAQELDGKPMGPTSGVTPVRTS